jgi:predicted RecB family nuclease
MTTVITDEILVANSLCPRKAYLLMFSEERGQQHEYQQILEQNRLANRQKYIDLIQQNPDAYPYSVENIKKDRDFLFNARLVADDLQADCDLLTKIAAQSYEPTLFIGTYSIDDTDKLRLMFIGYVLGKIQSNPPTIGHIVTIDGKSSKIKLQQGRKTLTSLLDSLHEWETKTRALVEPSIVLNKHCQLCQFQIQCEAKAAQEDNLSRLSGVTPRMIRRYERKGIFTVKQLSYLFKPRKRKKRAKNPPPSLHNIELQALAIRTGRIYIQEMPTLTRQETELFLDIESIPDQNLHYLHGLLVCQGETTTYYPFWADKADKEEKIWQKVWDKLNQYPDAPIYHYGSYETRTIAKLAKRYKIDIESLTKRMVNVHKQIYGKLYFPVYSNRLKDVAGFLGATWTEANASGLQSIVWRYLWDETHQDQYKDMLLIYNEEDCRALKLLVDELFIIRCSANTLPKVDFADRFKQQTTEVSEKVNSQFKEILKFAHFEYDSNKISFQQEVKNHISDKDRTEIRKLAAKRFIAKLTHTRQRDGEVLQVAHEKVCPKCGFEPLAPTKTISKRFIVDLTLTEKGIEKTVIEYNGVKTFCPRCKKYYVPSEIRKYSAIQVYGHGFRAWVVYQRVALRLPYESIVESAFEQFGEKINVGAPQYFLDKFAKYYASTEKQIVEYLLRSPFIHVDETKANIKGVNWYVWVFTDGINVILKLTETRETAIVQEFLDRYKGILIADFYGGYDAVQCRQQRCWVHLIRDLNDDILEHPFDKEYESFVLEVRDIILPIMEAVQLYGLKKQYLQGFMKQVDDFYARAIIDKEYKSDLVCTYQKRFVRYRESLFTFLELDDIPWNNNTAERAIRPFAKQRDMSTPFQSSVLQNYLVLLSIRQTCRFQNKSFFKFLFSEETDLENFSAETHKHSNSEQSHPRDEQAAGIPVGASAV